MNGVIIANEVKLYHGIAVSLRICNDCFIGPFAIVIAGLGTCVAGLLVFFLPQFTVENIFKMPFAEDYTIFVQHWGMMVLLVGVFMIISAFRVSWRMPILIYSTIEKTFMVFLYLFNISRSFSAGFQGGAIMDGVIVIYLLLYFWKGDR